MKYHMRWLFLIFLNLLFVLALAAQKTMTPGVVQDSVFRQLELYPQEKIHLHTDRNLYTSGEKIWFKAYVVDAFNHQSPTCSKYVYIELISDADSLMHRVMVCGDGFGLFHGNIFLSELIPEGDYTLRAYTRYMENLGDGYFFKKPIRIHNLKSGWSHPEEFALPERSMSWRGTIKQSGFINEYDVSFFPEGGYLTEGVICRMAFKALKRNGCSESISGEIVDHEGKPVAEVNTFYAGMGSINFTPVAGMTYYLICKNENGQEKRFKLPDAQKTYSIAVGYQKKRYLAEVIRTPEMPEKSLYLLVHCRGEVLYFAPWDYRNKSVSFQSNRIPSGVVQFILFDREMNPVSERLIFNQSSDQASLVFSSDKPDYQKREIVHAEIHVKDLDGNPLGGHVSVAVTDDRDMVPDTLHTITSSLLLSSELKGAIESPDYYLHNNNYSAFALDLLMLTNGWRRYDLSSAIKGNYRLPETGYEAVKELSGTVKNLYRGRPVANCEVLLVSSDGDFTQTRTDAAGVFRFYVHYPDSITFFVQTGRASAEPVLSHEMFPALKHAPKSHLQPLPGAETSNQTVGSSSEFIKKAEQRVQYDDDMRLVQLQEVVVNAKRIEKKDEARLGIWFNSSSNVTIYRETIEKSHTRNFTHLLYTVGGITTKGKVISIRGSNIPPLILIDGVIIESLDEINIQDIESIDIFKDASASIFGLRGGGGAISITTKRGENYLPAEPSMNFTSYTPTGFQQPVEFYAPKYDTPELKVSGTPDYRTTIFWKPDIIVSDDGKASFDFYTSDFPTTYSVVIEGLSNDGKIIRHIEKIVVK